MLPLPIVPYEPAVSPYTATLPNSISVSSMVYGDKRMVLEELAAESNAYQTLAAMGKILCAYRVRTIDAHGKYVPAELWNTGGYQLTILTNGKTIALLVQNGKGEITTVTADKIENGSAYFTVADVSSFAVIEITAPSDDDASSATKDSAGDKSANESASDSSGSSGSTGNTGNTGSTGGTNGAVQTGEPIPAALILMLLCALCAAVFLRRETAKP